MKVLITGCLGFIGSHCARHFVNAGHKVIGVNRNSNQYALHRVADFRDRKNFQLIFSDTATDVSGLCEGVDAVVNFAAKTFVDHSIKDPYPFIQSNVVGTYKLLEEARRYDVKMFIQISTDEVYGSIDEGYSRETDALNPTNPYSATKAAAEFLALSYFSTYSLPVIVTRTENNYGAYQHAQKAIPTFIRCALEDKKLPIYGDGKHHRMWLRAEDHCSAVEFLLENGKGGEIYNIGSKHEVENLALAEMILDILGKPRDLISFVPDYNIRPGHDRRYGIETEKLMSLGWKPKYLFENSLPEVVQWYKDNQWWLI